MRRSLLLFAWFGATLTGPCALAGQSSGPFSALEERRVERMLENRVACRGCHVIDGRGGLIGPVLDGIGSRAEASYVLSMIVDPGATVPGALMPAQPIASADAERMARYLMSRPAPAAAATARTPQAPVALDPTRSHDGAALYARHCSACHGEQGRGDGWNVANLPVRPTAHADPALMAERADDTLFDGIAVGGWVLAKSPLMPAFGTLLEPSQIRALVAHIRELCACEQPAWARGGGR